VFSFFSRPENLQEITRHGSTSAWWKRRRHRTLARSFVQPALVRTADPIELPVLLGELAEAGVLKAEAFNAAACYWEGTGRTWHTTRID
jgi:hypothetical protein